MAAEDREEVARRPISLGVLMVVPMVCLGYAILAFLNPFLRSSPLAVIVLSLLFSLSISAVILGTGRDPLDPFRLISACFALTYCVAPLFASGYDWYVHDPVPSLLWKGSVMALVAYLMIAAGYFLPFRRSGPDSRRAFRMTVRRDVCMIVAAALFAVGLLSFTVLFFTAGGVQEILGGEESRTDVARGVGYLLHASNYMYVGGALYFVTKLVSRRRPAAVSWIWGWPLLGGASMFIILQGRSLAVIGLISFVVISNYLIRPLRVSRATVYVIVLMVLAIFVGYARQPTVKGLLLTNPAAVVKEVADNFGPLLDTFLGHSMNRMKQAMLVLDHFPRDAPHRWGSTLFTAFNPVLRLIGLGEEQNFPLGRTFLQLALPELSTSHESGFHPSLLGEILVNFPWYVAPLPLFLYGSMVRWVYQRLVASRRDPVSLAIYSVIVFRIIDMVIVGIGQLLFPIAVLGTPLLVLRPLLVRPADAPVGAGVPGSCASSHVATG